MKNAADVVPKLKKNSAEPTFEPSEQPTGRPTEPTSGPTGAPTEPTERVASTHFRTPKDCTPSEVHESDSQVGSSQGALRKIFWK